MCGFGIAQLFEIAIAVIVLLAVIMIVRYVLPGIFTLDAMGGPFGNIIRIVCWAVAAVVVLLILWKFLACAGLVGIGLR
jgi:hypothetical protein